MRKLGFIVALSLLLVACTATPANEPSPKKQGVNISFLHYFSDPLNGGIDEMVKVFNDNQSDYVLKAVPVDHEAFKASIVKDLKSTSPPEVYSYWAGARVNSVLDDLEPIDDLWKASGMDKTFSTAVTASAVTYNGHQYLVPITQHLVVMFYNKKVFADLGIDPPQTWDDLAADCKLIKDAGITPFALGAKNRWPAQFWFDYMLLRTAGPEYRAKLMQGEARYSDKEVEDVFGLLSDWIKAGYFTENTQNYDWYEKPLEDFIEGKAAMTLMGTWALSVLSDPKYNFNAEMDYDYFIFPVMNDSQQLYALGPIDGLVIPKNAKYVDGGKAVLDFMAGIDAQKAMSEGSGAFSPNTSIEASFYSPIQRRMLEDVSHSQGWAFNYDLATPPEVAEIGLDLFKEFWEFPDAYHLLLNEADTKITDVWNTMGRD